MSTRTTVRQLMCPLMGGITGAISSGSATTIVVGTLAGSYPDDYFIGWKIVMPDAANAADVNRVCTDYAGATGTFTWSGNRTDTTYTSETFEVYPRDGYGYSEINDAMNRLLLKTRRPVRLTLPTIPNTRVYHLPDTWSWVTLPDHIRAVSLRHSPNLLSNADFAVWGNGPTAAPSIWSLTGAAATIARSIAYIGPGKHQVDITRAGTDAALLMRVRYIPPSLRGETVAFGAGAQSSTASHARASFSDGVTTPTNTSYHDGDTFTQFLSTTQVVNADALELQLRLQVNTTDAAASFWNPILVKGSTIDTNLRDYGDDYFKEIPLSGGDWRRDGTSIRLSFTPPEDAQLIVYTAQPYPSISSDSIGNDIGDDIWKWGTLADLSRIARPGVERSRWEYDYQTAARVYSNLAAKLLQVNLPQEPSQVVVRGA